MMEFVCPEKNGVLAPWH